MRLALSVVLASVVSVACSRSDPAPPGPSPATSQGAAVSRSGAPTPPRPPASAITAPAPSGATDITPAPPAPGPAAGQPMPELATVKKLALRKEQGGPAVKRCNGVAYEVEVDPTASTFSYRICDPNTKGPPGNEPLTRQTGKLNATTKAQIEKAYGQLLQEPARGCGHDGGPLTLTLTLKTGKTEKWVDQNWGCVQPPPQVAHGLNLLRLALMNVAAPEP